jgi:hypothetical protein
MSHEIIFDPHFWQIIEDQLREAIRDTLVLFNRTNPQRQLEIVRAVKPVATLANSWPVFTI